MRKHVMFPGPEPKERTKFCLVYCGPENCDCGADRLLQYDVRRPPSSPPPSTRAKQDDLLAGFVRDNGFDEDEVD